MQKGGAKLELDLDDLLVAVTYYYTIENDDRYAIFPSFRAWPFPHDNLPLTWTTLRQPRLYLNTMPARSFTAQAIIDRDPICLISDMGDARERAHMCPTEESDWFRSNDMEIYNLNHSLTPDAQIDDTSNATAMRADIHTIYDKPFFVTVRKEGHWTVHFIRPTCHLGSLYHNVHVKLHTDVSLEHMFSRFAWTIFPLVRNFLEQGPPRRIRTIDTSGNMLDENLDRATIVQRFFAPRERSASPKKRKTGGGDNLPAVEQSDEMEHRGRKRRRRVSSAYGRGEIAEFRDGDSSRISFACQGCTGSLSTSPSSIEHVNPSVSGHKPISPPTTATIDQSQGHINNYDETGIEDKDPRVQEWYSEENEYARMR